MKKILFVIIVLWNSTAFADEAQKYLNHFTAIKTQMSEFKQISKRGSTIGTMYIQRPGKVRLFYKSLPLNIIADGQSLLVNNTRADSWNLYKLANTPFAYLLSNHIDTNSKYYQGMQKVGDDIVVAFARTPEDASAVYLYFDGKSKNLKKWVIVNDNNETTTTVLYNTKTNVVFAKDMFSIPYKEISSKRQSS